MDNWARRRRSRQVLSQSSEHCFVLKYPAMFEVNDNSSSQHRILRSSGFGCGLHASLGSRKQPAERPLYRGFEDNVCTALRRGISFYPARPAAALATSGHDRELIRAADRCRRPLHGRSRGTIGPARHADASPHARRGRRATPHSRRRQTAVARDQSGPDQFDYSLRAARRRQNVTGRSHRQHDEQQVRAPFFLIPGYFLPFVGR